jgi:uncharacterized protein (TIGR03435 family)
MAAAISVMLLVASFCLRAQAPSKTNIGPSFDVASVRVAPSSDGLPEGFAVNPRLAGERLSWTTNLYSLVRYAYHVQGWRITGITPESSFYRIDASLKATPSQEEVRSMLRQLLVDRFKLTTHTRVEERSGYALVILNGPKLQRAAATAEATPMPSYLKGKPAAAFEGQLFASAEGQGIAAITGRGVPLARLAETLSDQLQEFVIDRTGIAGNYYFGFTFRRLDYANADAPEVASIFDALRDELGLRLDRQKGPVELLVIDHVEPPTPN